MEPHGAAGSVAPSPPPLDAHPSDLLPLPQQESSANLIRAIRPTSDSPARMMRDSPDPMRRSSQEWLAGSMAARRMRATAEAINQEKQFKVRAAAPINRQSSPCP